MEVPTFAEHIRDLFNRHSVDDDLRQQLDRASSIKVNFFDTLQAVKEVKRKATGLDGMRNSIFKDEKFQATIAWKLKNAMNRWFVRKQFPNYLKASRVIPLSKKSSKYPPVGEIRTIAILPTVSPEEHRGHSCL